MAESKVKSHSRRSKDGKQVRVKEGKRKSIGKKLAIAGGLVGLGLAGTKLTREVIRKKSIRDFNPKSDGKIMINVYQGKTKNTSILTDSQIRLERARQVAPAPKKIRNQVNVVKRRDRFTKEAWLLPSRDSTIAPGRGYIEPDFSPDKNTRKQQGERISKAAEALAYKKGRFKK